MLHPRKHEREHRIRRLMKLHDMKPVTHPWKQKKIKSHNTISIDFQG